MVSLVREGLKVGLIRKLRLLVLSWRPPVRANDVKETCEFSLEAIGDAVDESLRLFKFFGSFEKDEFVVCKSILRRVENKKSETLWANSDNLVWECDLEAGLDFPIVGFE